MASELTYDVFLSHATPDKPTAEELARRLRAEGLKPFLDKWHLVPGEPWQEAIEVAMARSRTCMVFIGPGPLGPWQNEEMRNALDMRVRDNSRRVIPVLLPGASMSALPPFLARLTCVDFRSGFNDPQAFQRLVCGITGKEPDEGQAGSSPGQAPWQRRKGRAPRAKDLRQLWFEWPESLYGRFNFQRAEHIIALTEWLMGADLPAVVILGGEPGIGRGFLCDAAVRRARDQGHRMDVWHLDLDGFEPDIQNPLTQYLRHLIDEEERYPDAARDKAKGSMKLAVKTLCELDLLGQASEVAASLLSLLWQFVTPLKHLAVLLDQPPRGTGVPPRDDPETLHRFLAELTRDRKLLVHVDDGPQLTSHLRRWLIREAERAPERLLLAISCPLDQTTERAAPEARSKPERIDVQPLNAAELRDLLDRRFEPNEFPGDLVGVLMRRCHGRPVAIANQLADLMEAELLFSEGETWRLPPAGLKDPRLVDAFSRGLFEEVDKSLAMLAEEEPELARVLRDLLSLAALCGRHVPMAAILDHLHLDENTSEAAIDWVDDVLVDELGWLSDLGFHVSGFPGYNVYAFTHPLLPLVILDQESEIARELRAADLLRFLEPRVSVTRKGWARCFLSIAEHLSALKREPYELSLAWWIGLEAADLLKAEVRMAIERGEIDPEIVWRVAEDSEAWPSYRRLAVLEAYAQATVGEGAAAMALLPFDRLADFHLLHGKLLIHVGFYPEALADALNALKLISREPIKRSKALNLSGLARLNLGDARTAKPDFEAALALNLENFGEEDLSNVPLRSNLALALRGLGDLVGARKLEEESLKIRDRVLGCEHTDTLKSRNNLAVTLRALGDYIGARKLLEQNLEIHERTLGGEHPKTFSSRNNLATCLLDLGDLGGARKLLEQTLKIQERVLGRDHPDTLQVRNNLAFILDGLGDLAGARKLHEQNLEIYERVLGGKHPQTTVSTWNLRWTVHQLNDLDAEARLIDKLRWLLDHDEDSIPSAQQWEIRQELLDLLNPS